MTAAISMTVPGGRVVPTWWVQLDILRPQALWFAHLLLHRVEAVVETTAPSPLSQLGRVLFTFLLHRSAPVRLADLQRELALDAQLVRLALQPLLASHQVAIHSDGTITIPSNGEITTVENDHFRQRQRQVFYFTEGRNPLYLPLKGPFDGVDTPPGGWRFDLGILDACIQRSADWKRTHGFPLEVKNLIRPTLSEERIDPSIVPLDSPNQVMLVLVLTEENRLVGLPILPEQWELQTDPILQVAAEADWLPALTGEINADTWKQAWQAWCQQRSLPGGDVESCKLELMGYQLKVKAPSRLTDRLRQMKSEALRGEAWLFAGSGRIRPMAQIELVS